MLPVDHDYCTDRTDVKTFLNHILPTMHFLKTDVDSAIETLTKPENAFRTVKMLRGCTMKDLIAMKISVAVRKEIIKVLHPPTGMQASIV